MIAHPRFARRLRRALGTLATAVVIVAVLAPAGIAADLTDIGFVDQGAIAALPQFQRANADLAKYKAQLDREFANQIRGQRDAGAQARIAQEFQNKFAQKQRDVLGPQFLRAQVAIASVASSKNLSVVVDKRIIVFGGQDVTKDVLDLLTGPGDPIPPVNTPPPSSVGYVDQSQIDALPKMKNAADTLQKFQQDQQKGAQDKFKSAKSDQEKQQILADLQKSLADKQKEVLQPLVDQTKSAIESVARKHNLLLVIDRTNLVYGGMDITSDVVAALK